MPSPTTWKKHTSLLLSRLRSKRAATGGSSLVVQAGFPTSLADLFVKNHKKILPNKKPSNKRNGPVNPNPNPIPQPPFAAADTVRYPSRTADIDRSTSSSRSRRLGLGLGFLVVGLLAVGKKWVVVGITILSLFLLVLELCGLVEKKKKPPPGTEEDRADLGVVDLRGRGLVSPIREASRCSDLESDISSERSEISAEKRDFDGDRSSGSDVFLERRESLGEESDVSVERRDIDDDRGLENSTKKRRKKKRKLFGKLFRRKCSRKNDEKEEKCPCLDDCGEKEEGFVDEDGNDLDEFLSLEDSDIFAEIESEEAVSVGENVAGTRTRLWRWRKLVFFVVVLFGLLGGKVAAVALTLAYVLVSGCTGTVWRR